MADVLLATINKKKKKSESELSAFQTLQVSPFRRKRTKIRLIYI
jgi:hypothetical protein